MSDCLINFIVDNCEIEVVCICSLQDIGLLLQALKRFILYRVAWERGRDGRREKQMQGGSQSVSFSFHNPSQCSNRSKLNKGYKAKMAVWQRWRSLSCDGRVTELLPVTVTGWHATGVSVKSRQNQHCSKHRASTQAYLGLFPKPTPGDRTRLGFLVATVLLSFHWAKENQNYLLFGGSASVVELNS